MNIFFIIQKNKSRKVQTFFQSGIFSERMSFEDPELRKFSEVRIPRATPLKRSTEEGEPEGAPYGSYASAGGMSVDYEELYGQKPWLMAKRDFRDWVHSDLVLQARFMDLQHNIPSRVVYAPRQGFKELDKK